MHRWLERAVIGLNLCPFAKAVHVKGQIHYSVSLATSPEQLLNDMLHQCQELMETPVEQRETTLLMAPWCLSEFLDFNDFLGEVDFLLDRQGWSGVLQVASFHPDFQFAGTERDDISNLTNQAPYPTLHLLREESIDRAVEAFPEAEAIFEVNIKTVEALGHQGWSALGIATSVSHAMPITHGLTHEKK